MQVMPERMWLKDGRWSNARSGGRMTGGRRGEPRRRKKMENEAEGKKK